MQWVKQSASKLEWAKLPLAYTTHILFHVISTYIQEFSESSTKWKWSFEALEIKARYLNSFYCPATAFPVSPEPTSNGFLFGIFLTVYSEHKLSAAHLQNPCLFEEPSHSNPKSRIHSISTTSAHLLSWVCVQGFAVGATGVVPQGSCPQVWQSHCQSPPRCTWPRPSSATDSGSTSGIMYLGAGKNCTTAARERSEDIWDHCGYRKLLCRGSSSRTCS